MGSFLLHFPVFGVIIVAFIPQFGALVVYVAFGVCQAVEGVVFVVLGSAVLSVVFYVRQVAVPVVAVVVVLKYCSALMGYVRHLFQA